MSTNSVRLGHFLRRALPVAGMIALASAVTMLVTKPAEGTLPYSLYELKALHDIEDLEYCYAAGTDAVGRNDLAKGKQIYSQCFTPNAPVVIYGPGAAPGDPPAVDVPSAQAWADVMNGLFRDAGYIGTQHMITNIRVDIAPNGHEAKVISYLDATHVIDPVGLYLVAHGHYESDAVLTPFGWRLKNRTFYTLDFMPIAAAAP